MVDLPCGRLIPSGGTVPGMDASTSPVRRRRRTYSIALIGAVVLSAGAIAVEGAMSDPAPPPNRVFIFTGHGFGHGVGLSQWGARKGAQEGLDAAAILKHYYSGVDITTHEPADIRVKLIEDVAEVTLAHEGTWSVTHDGTLTVTRSPTFRITREGDEIVATGASETATFRSSSELTFRALTPIGVDGRRYRGTIRVVPTANGVDVINTVPIESYLRSVVSREMSPDWADDAAEALRAQAIVARTYALASRTPSREFDVMDDQRSQVYGGVTDEDPRTDAAVTATKGEVVTYEGRLITTYYSASSGGHTEDGDRVFPAGEPQPYLAGVPDPYDADAPLHTWGSPPVFTADELRDRLDVALPIRSIDILERGASPRVFRARVNLIPFGSRELTGSAVRASLGLPDTWFTILLRTTGDDGGPAALPEDAARSDVWLTVLNGGTLRGAARDLADTAEERGYVGVGAGNAPTHTGTSTVYFAPGSEAAAERVAEDLAIPGPVVPLAEAHGLTEAPKAANVVVVIGAGAP